MRRLRRRAATLLLALAATASQASAWTSIHKAAIRHYPATKVPLPGLYSGQFSATFLEDAIGGPVELDEGYPNTNVLACTPAFVGKGEPQELGDLRLCQTAEGHIASKEWGWLVIRKKGSAGETSEHTLISTASAQRSGLDTTAIFRPFWIRYATKDAYVASPETVTGPSAGATWVAAQSLLPTGGIPGSTHAVRSVALLELSQLPDDSSSVADFAAGNELCPLNGMDGFAGTTNDACHQFRAALGATNVTHFKPMNRAMWSYYHTLARRRMRQCAPLAALNADYYDDWNINWSSSPALLSNLNTEAHECEREAMAYEMFAQHFLQDAWATGHMWRRWGRPSLKDFPYIQRSEDPSKVPGANIAPRRTLIANMIAVGTGIVHGDKSVLEEEFFRKYGFLAPFESFSDDPLNAPEYSYLPKLRAPVQWVAIGESSGVYRGGGDIYWAPSDAPLGTIGGSDEFKEQRDRILNCGAASMLETYREGPQLHGSPATTDFSEAIGRIDLKGDYCWGQLATNRSMVAAAGFTDATYGPGLITGMGAASLGRWLVGNRVDGLAIPPKSDVEADTDWATFKDKLGDYFAEDFSAIRRAYEAQAHKAPEGTDAANGKTVAGGRITLLGVDGMDDADLTTMNDPATPPTPPPGVPYVDRLQTDLPDGPATDLEKATARMFWRGNINATCHDTLDDNAALLNSLQQRCLQNAERGGDPDSCTECVYRAAEVIPRCVPVAGHEIGGSMCSETGAIADAHQPGLPDWWFDRHRSVAPWLLPEPWDGDDYACVHPYYVALQWCSGTKSTLTFPEVRTPTHLQDDVTGVFPCPSGVRHSFIRHWRSGRMLDEFQHDDPSADPTKPRPHLLPMFTAFSGTTEVKAGNDPCDESQDSSSWTQARVVAANLAPADPTRYVNNDFAGNFPSGADVPRCGIQQRVSVWGATCKDAMTQLAYHPTVDSGTRSQLTGEEWSEFSTSDGPRCYVQEPRTFVPTCTDPRLSCNAGWQCVPSVVPNVRLVE